MASHLQQRWDANFQGLTSPRSARLRLRRLPADPLAGWDLTIPADVAADIADAEAAVRSAQRRRTRLMSASKVSLASCCGPSRSARPRSRASRPRPADSPRPRPRIALGGDANDRVAVEVLGNIAAMESAVELATSADPFELDDLLSVHRILMDNSPTPELGGVVREEQNWIGGSSFNPCSADVRPATARVPPRAARRPARLRERRRALPPRPGRHRPRPVRDPPPLRRRKRTHRPSADPRRPPTPRPRPHLRATDQPRAGHVVR